MSDSFSDFSSDASLEEDAIAPLGVAPDSAKNASRRRRRGSSLSSVSSLGDFVDAEAYSYDYDYSSDGDVGLGAASSSWAGSNAGSRRNSNADRRTPPPTRVQQEGAKRKSFSASAWNAAREALIKTPTKGPGFADIVEKVMADNTVRGRSLGGADEHVDLSSFDGVSDVGVRRVVRAHPDLDSLDFADCARLTDVSCRFIATEAKLLRFLSLRGCEGITDEGVSYIADHCGMLDTLVLSWCPNVTDEGLKHLALKLTTTKLTLDVSGDTAITDCGVISILDSHGQYLRGLLLSHCSGVRGHFLNVLSRRCPNLQRLALDDCSWLSSAAIAGAVVECTELKELCLANADVGDDVVDALVETSDSKLMYLDVSECKKITDSAFVRLARRCRRLRLLNASDTQFGVNAGFAFANQGKELRSLDVRGCLRVRFVDVQALTRRGVVVSAEEGMTDFDGW